MSKLKLALVGPGVMDIPPQGWGAVEMLIWDYYKVLTKSGVYVDIINTPDKATILSKVNNGNYDAVHVHYDLFVDLMDKIKAKAKIISSHYPSLNSPEYYVRDGYDKIMPQIVKNEDYYIFCSSEADQKTFVSNGANSEHIFRSRLGVKIDEYAFYPAASYKKTLCFSQIIERKRQFLIQDIEGVDIVGKFSRSFGLS